MLEGKVWSVPSVSVYGPVVHELVQYLLKPFASMASYGNRFHKFTTTREKKKKSSLHGLN